MVGAPVLNQPLHESFITLQNHRINPEFDFDVKVQECISLTKKCKDVRELRQVHAQILKLGLFHSSLCASNLLTTCALSQWGSMDYACSIFRNMEDLSSFEFNAMIRGYVKDLNFEKALLVYHEMIHMGTEPDKFSFPAVLKACALSRAYIEGLQIHAQILKMGFAEDVFVQNSLVNLYGKCGEIKSSLAVFEQIYQKTIASWSAIIAAHASLGMWRECLRLFSDMNSKNCSWDRAEESTLVSVISACTHLGALDLGRSIHGYVLRNLTGLNVAVTTCLIDMYINCGKLDKGMFLFREASERNGKCYSVVISGLAIHGHGEEALKLFEQMLEQGLKPDDVVYVGVLNACSRAGLVESGLSHFEKMRNEHGIQPTIQHYGCLVDLLGRAGLIDKALGIIENMPIKPNDVIWRSLLSACKVHQHVDTAEIAFENLLKLKTRNPSDYLMLANMYARAQRWGDIASIRTQMTRLGLRQEPGFSSVEVDKKVHRFVSYDTSHPRCNEIYEMIHQIEWQLKFEGYLPDTSQVLLDVDEEEKRQRLRTHSQKLAIAFSLISTEKGSVVRIVRNVRMCSDCHEYTKLISTIYEREIIVRDRNIFHRFRDGTCSCKDYW